MIETVVALFSSSEKENQPSSILSPKDQNLIDQLQVNRALAYNTRLHGFLHPRGIAKATLGTCYSLSVESPNLYSKTPSLSYSLLPVYCNSFAKTISLV